MNKEKLLARVKVRETRDPVAVAQAVRAKKPRVWSQQIISLTSTEKELLERLARKFHVTKSDIVRASLKSFKVIEDQKAEEILKDKSGL